MTTITLANGKTITLGNVSTKKPRTRLQTHITNEMHERGYMTAKEAAELLQITTSYVHLLHYKGFLGSAAKRGRLMYFRRDWVERYQEERGQ